MGIHRLQKNGVAVSLLGDPDGTLFKSILYVRQTSVELRGHIRQVMQSSARDGVITRKRFAVTGTPGIGKSSFSNYFAAMVLREGKTVFYQFKEEYGVVLEPGKNGQPPQATIYDVLTAFHGVVRRADAESGWYLIDSATPIVSKVPALLVTSTQPRFYNDWLKQGGGAPFYMPLPEEEEIRKLRDVVQPAVAANAPIVAEIRDDPRRYGFSFDLAEAEKGFARPTLIIAARQDTVVGYRDAWDILESYPRATFAVIDRADHGWPIESPRLLSALVADWLDRIELSEMGA